MSEAGELLNIGTLTGTVELDDRLSSSLEIVSHHIEKFADEFLGQFKSIAIGVGLVTTAIVGLTSTIVTLAVKGSEINDVHEGFDRLAGSAQNAEEILAAMRKGVVGIVSDLELMRDANRLLSAGVKGNAEDFQTLTTAAHVLANEGYGSLESVLSSLNRAMITGSTFRVKQLGVNIDATKAEKAYAAALGLTAEQLTREQKVEAVRGALLDSLNEKVKAAGELHLSFAEKFDAAITSIKNWSAQLASMVAASPQVNKAFDDIAKAISDAFGGEGQSLLETIVGWFNAFASAVSTYGPPIIRMLGSIKDVIVAIWNSVEAAWDSLPDWLKEVVKDAAIVSVGFFLAEKALDSLLAKATQAKGLNLGGGGGGGDALGTVASGATITSGVIDSAKALAAIGERFGGIGEKISSARVALNKFGEGIGLVASFTPTITRTFVQSEGSLNLFRSTAVAATGASAGLLAQFGTGAVFVASAVAVWTAASTAIENHRLSVIRDAEAQRQNVTDQENIQKISKLTGKTYTDLGSAIADANKFIREHKKAWDDERNSHAAADAIAAVHIKTVETETASLVALTSKIDTTADVFSKLTTTQKLNRQVQDELIKRMDAQIAAHIQLNDKEAEYYEMITRSRSEDTKYAAAKLNNSDAIKKQADALRDLALVGKGLSEDEIAKQLGMSTAALHESEKPLLERIAALEREGLSEAAITERLHTSTEARQLATEQIKRQQQAQDDLTNANNQNRLTISHGGLDEWKKDQEDKKAIEIRNLRESKDWTQQAEDNIQLKYKQTAQVKQMTDEEGIAGSRAAAIKERDVAKNKYDTMLSDLSGFHADDVRVAGEDYRDKARAAEHFSATASEAEKVAAKAAEEASVKRQDALKAEQKAQEDWKNSWHDVTVSMTRDQAVATAATTGGGMWADWFRAVALAAIKAMDDAELKANMAAYQTTEDLKHIADVALKTYNAMLVTGKYTAETLAEAWKKYTDAQQAAFGETKKTLAEINEELVKSAGFRTKKELDDLAQQAKKTYDYMAATGKYTAQELTKAWENYTNAQKEALGLAAELSGTTSGGATSGPVPGGSGLGKGLSALSGAMNLGQDPVPGRPLRGSQVVFGPGSVVVQYPIMNDEHAKNQIASMIGDAVVGKIKGRGVNLGG